MSSSPLKVEPVAKAQEPSMEEILASIRKIISDDDSRAAPAPAAPQQAAPDEIPNRQADNAGGGQDDLDDLLGEFEASQASSGVLELTEDMAAPTEQLEGTDLDFIDAPAPPDPDDTDSPEPEPDPLPPIRPEIPQMRVEQAFPRSDAGPRLDDRLISNATDSAISAAFGSLTHTILSQNARTLDDLVQDMLRPMLKSWLDDNLPTLVERLVRAEIERVSRGSR